MKICKKKFKKKKKERKNSAPLKKCGYFSFQNFVHFKYDHDVGFTIMCSCSGESVQVYHIVNNQGALFFRKQTIQYVQS